MQPAAPQYCQVIGAIAAARPDGAADPLPGQPARAWNGRALQFGGGGFNGVLVTGLGLPPARAARSAAPLARGFATYGTDSGHQNAPAVPLQASP